MASSSGPEAAEQAHPDTMFTVLMRFSCWHTVFGTKHHQNIPWSHHLHKILLAAFYIIHMALSKLHMNSSFLKIVAYEVYSCILWLNVLLIVDS